RRTAGPRRDRRRGIRRPRCGTRGPGRPHALAARTRVRSARGLPASLPEEARIRVARGLGAPRLVAVGLSAVGASVYFILGVVAKHALGLTPVVFLAASVFFLITTMTYLEGNS